MNKLVAITVTLGVTFVFLLLFCLWDREFKFLLLWAIHLVPMALAGVPLWYFGRRRVCWGSYDFLVTTVPFLVYLSVLFVWTRENGLGNLMDLLVLGCCLPLAPLTRVVAGPRAGGSKLPAGLLVLLCLLAAGLYAFVPFLPG